MARRTTQGLSKEIIRCLKRYVAREVFAALMKTSPNGLAQAPDIYRSVTAEIMSGQSIQLRIPHPVRRWDESVSYCRGVRCR
jgi:hypothetical protein